MPRLGAALLAEFVGTLALCLVGILAIHSGAGLVAIALGHGLILSTMVSATMQTSGGQFNPAVTIGLLITGRMRLSDAVGYIFVQIVAGVVAGLIVIGLFGTEAGARIVYDGTPKLLGGIAMHGALIAEIVATFFLVFVVFGTGVDSRARNVGGFAIGLTVAADILAFGPISGAAMNPARVFGPAIVASLDPDKGALWSHHWIYWIGPIVGGALAALAHHFVLIPRGTK